MKGFHFPIAALLASFVISISAHASPVPPSETIAVEGDGTELTGSYTVTEFGGGPVGTFNYIDGATSYTFHYSDLVSTGVIGTGNFASETFVNAAGDTFFLGGLLAPPSTQTVEFICSTANPCSTGGADPESVVSFVNPYGTDDQDFVSNGDLHLVPAAQTPEPSSIALLGTGVLGLVGAARRRFIKA